MIDLILRAGTTAALVAFADKYGLRREIVTPAVLDELGNEVTPEAVTYEKHPEVEWSFWAGSGKLMTAKGTYDAQGNEITPPTFASGVVVLLRIHHAFFDNDRLEPDEADPDRDEQWARSKVARYIRNNGTPGTTGPISWYELDGVRIYRPADVAAYLQANDLPGHRYL